MQTTCVVSFRQEMSVLQPPVEPPKLVLFDAGGVLITPPLERQRALTDGALALEEVRRIFYAAYSATSIPTEKRLGDFWKTYATCLGLADNPFAGLDTSRRDGAHGLIRWNEAVPHAAVVLAAIKERDIAVAVVSNAAGDVHRLLTEAGVCQTGTGQGTEIDFIFDSGDTTRYSDEAIARKPNTTMLDDACAHFGVSAADALFVGDAIWADVLAAQRAGIPFLHMDPFGDCRDFDTDGLTLRSTGHDHVQGIEAVLPFALGERQRSVVKAG